MVYCESINSIGSFTVFYLLWTATTLDHPSEQFPLVLLLLTFSKRFSAFKTRAPSLNFQQKLKGHLSPFCTCAAVWFLIQRNTFQSWYMWEKSFSIDLMSRVEIVIQILKNCFVGHDLFKWHISFLEFKTAAKIRCFRKRIFKAARDESYFIWSTWKKR